MSQAASHTVGIPLSNLPENYAQPSCTARTERLHFLVPFSPRISIILNRRAFNATKGYQRKKKVAAVGKCPTCHKEIALIAETEEWEQRDDMTWEHVSWGPAIGVRRDHSVEIPD